MLHDCSNVKLEGGLEAIKVASVGEFWTLRDKLVDEDFGGGVENDVEEHLVFADSSKTEKLVEFECNFGATVDLKVESSLSPKVVEDDI